MASCLHSWLKGVKGRYLPIHYPTRVEIYMHIPWKNMSIEQIALTDGTCLIKA